MHTLMETIRYSHHAYSEFHVILVMVFYLFRKWLSMLVYIVSYNPPWHG